VDCIQSQLDDQNAKSLADEGLLLYIYCDRNDQERQDCETLFASIMRQVVWNRLTDLFPHARRFYIAHKSKHPRQTDYEECIYAHTQRISQVLLVIDALNEIRDKYSFVEGLSRFQTALGSRLRILVTSCSDKRVVEQLKVDADNHLPILTAETDLRIYITKRIEQESPRLFEPDSSLKKEIVETVLKNAAQRYESS
jgi:hypothetical protein